jgi:hypothetical protein
MTVWLTILTHACALFAGAIIGIIVGGLNRIAKCADEFDGIENPPPRQTDRGKGQ